jgi:hypothetical protein
MSERKRVTLSERKNIELQTLHSLPLVANEGQLEFGC